MKKSVFLLSSFLLIILGSFLAMPLDTWAVECGNVKNRPPGVTIDGLNISNSSLNISFSGETSQRIKYVRFNDQFGPGCEILSDGYNPGSYTVEVDGTSITTSGTINPGGDFSKDVNLNISSLTPGQQYTAKVTVTSGGYSVYDIQQFSLPPLPPSPPPSGQPPTVKLWAEYPLGTVVSKVSKGTAVYLVWNSSGATKCNALAGAGFETNNATSGSDQVSALDGTTTFSIECSNLYGSTQANATVEVVPRPTVNLTISPSQVVKNNDHPDGDFTVSWSSSNAVSCRVEINAGIGIGIGGTSGSIQIPAAQNISASITCKNELGDTASASATGTAFYNYVHWRAVKVASCTSTSFLGFLPQLEKNGSSPISFTAVLDGYSRKDNSHLGTITYPNSKLNDGDDRSWNYWISKYSVEERSVSNVPSNYQYCGNSGAVTVAQDPTVQYGDPNPNNQPRIDLYFAPASGEGQGNNPPPSPSDFGIVGECHQNHPNVLAQAFLGWSPVSGATYNVYRNGTKIASTQNTWYIDLDVSFGGKYSYYVTSVSGGKESNPSNTLSVTIPTQNQCINDNPPPPPSGHTPTYVISPSLQSVNVGSQVQFFGLYDPDGPDIRYGEFNVSNLASWSSANSSIAFSKENGVFEGVSSGTTKINSTYGSISANATLNVLSNNSPDFRISISPSLQTVTKPGSTSYTVTVSPVNNFSGNVSLSVSNLPSGVSYSLNPPSINTSGTSQLTLTVNSSAAYGRSTFSVIGQSGQMTHEATADIIVQGSVSADISASPSNIAPGASSTLYWSSSGATSCSIDQRVGQVCDSLSSCSKGGDESVSPPQTTTYTLTCSNGTESASDSVTVYVTPQGLFSCNLSPQSPGGQAPLTVNFVAQPSGGGVPPYVAAYWCKKPWSGQGQASGSCVYSSNGTYEVTAHLTDSLGQLAQCYSTVYVGSQPPPGDITCNLSVTPQSGQAGVTVFSFNAYDVQGGNGNYTYNFKYGDGNQSGFQSSPLSYYAYSAEGQYNASVDVRDSSGKSGTCSISPSVVNVSPPPPPGCNFYATPSAIIYGQSSTLSWSCSPPGTQRTCTVKDSSGQQVGSGNQEGSVTVKPRRTTTYTLSCEGVDDSTVTVKVGFIPVLREIIPR